MARRCRDGARRTFGRAPGWRWPSAVFAVVLLAFGKNPLRAYVDILSSTLGSAYGFSETLVTMTPLLLTALAVAVPSRIWLINVGGEGQLFIGAVFATWGAIHLGHLPGGYCCR